MYREKEELNGGQMKNNEIINSTIGNEREHQQMK